MFFKLILFFVTQSQPAPAGETPQTASPLPPVTQQWQSYRPPEGTSLNRSLRSSPSEEAPVLRLLLETDRITYLRTEGLWYEVDLKTAEGLEFKGWVKGTLPSERVAPTPPPPPTERAQGPNPLNTKGIVWFWQPEATDVAHLTFGTGIQNIDFSMAGRTASGTAVSVPPQYSFNGWNLGLKSEFFVLATQVKEFKLKSLLRAQYSYGFYSVSFAGAFSQIPEIAEVAGAGYQINTHLFSFEGLTRMRVTSWARKNFDTEIGLGLGFFYYDVAPDLDALEGATYTGQLIFTDTTFSAVMIPIEFKFDLYQDYYVEPKFAVFLMPSLSANANWAPGLKSTGFPIRYALTLGWHFTKLIDFEVDTEMLSLQGKVPDSGADQSRLGTTYREATVDLSYIRFAGAAKFKF